MGLVSAPPDVTGTRTDVRAVRLAASGKFPPASLRAMDTLIAEQAGTVLHVSKVTVAPRGRPWQSWRRRWKPTQSTPRYIVEVGGRRLGDGSHIRFDPRSDRGEIDPDRWCFHLFAPISVRHPRVSPMRAVKFVYGFDSEHTRRPHACAGHGIGIPRDDRSNHGYRLVGQARAERFRSCHDGHSGCRTAGENSKVGASSRLASTDTVTSTEMATSTTMWPRPPRWTNVDGTSGGQVPELPAGALQLEPAKPTVRPTTRPPALRRSLGVMIRRSAAMTAVRASGSNRQRSDAETGIPGRQSSSDSSSWSSGSSGGDSSGGDAGDS